MGYPQLEGDIKAKFILGNCDQVIVFPRVSTIGISLCVDVLLKKLELYWEVFSLDFKHTTAFHNTAHNVNFNDLQFHGLGSCIALEVGPDSASGRKVGV